MIKLLVLLAVGLGAQMAAFAQQELCNEVLGNGPGIYAIYDTCEYTDDGCDPAIEDCSIACIHCGLAYDGNSGDSYNMTETWINYGPEGEYYGTSGGNVGVNNYTCYMYTGTWASQEGDVAECDIDFC